MRVDERDDGRVSIFGRQSIRLVKVGMRAPSAIVVEYEKGWKSLAEQNREACAWGLLLINGPQIEVGCSSANDGAVLPWHLDGAVLRSHLGVRRASDVARGAVSL